MIYKNNYVVEFWYDTHLTHEWNGHSYDEIAAFVLAGEELELKKLVFKRKRIQSDYSTGGIVLCQGR